MHLISKSTASRESKFPVAQTKMSSSETKTYFHRGLIDSTKKLYLNSKTADVRFLFDSDDGAVTRIPANRE